MDRINWSLGARYRGPDFRDFCYSAERLENDTDRMRHSLMRASFTLAERCEAERRELRQQIWDKDPTARTSPVYLTAVRCERYVKLEWRELDRTRPSGLDSVEHLPSHVVSTSGADGVDNPPLLRRANVAERDLITYHNGEVQCMRRAWMRFADWQIAGRSMRDWTRLPGRD